MGSGVFRGSAAVLRVAPPALPQVSACSRPGCSKPSWNGQPGEYCSPECKEGWAGTEENPQAISTCLRQDCGKPTWNGLPNEYCCRNCKDTSAGAADALPQAEPSTAPSIVPTSPICARPGCSKPSWNGMPNEFCSRTCRNDAVPGGLAAHGPSCSRPGCGKPTWNGQPGEFCSRSCKAGRVCQPQPGDEQNLEKVVDAGVLQEFEHLLRVTHKASNNWTRDRGCSKHGHNNCADSCILSNNAPVPAGYQLVKVEWNRNTALWRQYSQARLAIQWECASQSMYRGEDILSSRPPFDAFGKNLGLEPLAKDCNEWLLFHGAPRKACEDICQNGFQVGMAGTGATFKVGGRPKRPLYGWGVYFAEMITKSDEYAREVSRFSGHFCVLVCRVVGGAAHVVTEDSINEQTLKSQVIHGPCHSVLGDRVTKLGKPFREVVVYSSDQIFPEFIVTYKRL